MLSSVSLQQFRSYDKARFDFSPSVTIIGGPNGSGKTNILEALYVLCRGISFRGASSDEMCQFGATWWRLDADVDMVRRTATYDISRSGLKKRFSIQGNEKSRLSVQQYVPVVVFEPNDLRLLQGSPTRRRTFIDTYIAQLDPLYQTLVNRYERALKQRNNLLKSADINRDNLFVWDLTLSELGGTITYRRAQLIQQLNADISEVYGRVAETNDAISLTYVSRLLGDNGALRAQPLQQQLLSLLHASRERDILLGHTSIGPHRDDIAFFMNGHDAAHTASRGETRTIVLALKFLEIQQLQQEHTKQPLLLLDDVFSELDTTRRKALLHATSDCQMVITTTDADITKKESLGDHTLITTA